MMRAASFAAMSCALAGCVDFGIFVVGDGGTESDAGPDSGPPEVDAGPPPLSCQGVFGTGTKVVDDVGLFQSPAVTGDELEIFYGASMVPGGPQELRVSSRNTSDVNFPAGRRLEEVEAQCPPLGTGTAGRTVDVSADGLELYVSCYDTTMPVDAPLLHFHRPDRMQPFALVGQVGSAYCCASVSPDGRELYWSTSPGALMVAARIDPGDVFGPSMPVPGLEAIVARSPDLTPDGRSLFVSQAPANSMHEYARAAAGGGFDPTPIMHPVLPTATVVGGPDITTDCRRMYFAGAVTDMVTGATTQDIYVSAR